MSFLYIILPVFYLVVLAFFVFKLKYFSSTKIQKKYIVLLSIIKMLSGILYIVINEKYIQGGDIFHYFKDGNIIFSQLKENPSHYLELIFSIDHTYVPEHLSVVIDKMGYWADSGSYMLVRFNALIRLISFGNFYVHGVFASFFSFLGSFYILKVFEKELNAEKVTLLSIILTPTLLLWTSGVHKEFVSVLALGLILYYYFKLIETSYTFKNLLFFLLGIVLFFVTRNYMLLTLIPSLVSYTIYKKFHLRYKRAVYFSLVLLIGFLNFQKIPKYNKTGFEVIIEKRKQFVDLKNGNTAIDLDYIEPNFISLMKNSPKALFNTLLRPHFFEVKNTFLALASIESFIISILLLSSILYFHKLNKKESHLIIFFLLYSISLLLIIGWIVPNIGAIIRYRSLAIICLVPASLHVLTKRFKFYV